MKQQFAPFTPMANPGVNEPSPFLGASPWQRVEATQATSDKTFSHTHTLTRAEYVPTRMMPSIEVFSQRKAAAQAPERTSSARASDHRAVMGESRAGIA